MSAAAPSKEVLEKVCAQVDFYFGDANLRRDRHLRSKIEADPQRFVAITHLLTFNKLKELTTEVQVVAQAVRDTPSKIVEVNADGTALRRIHAALPKKQEAIDVSVFLSGFPVESKMDDVIQTIKNWPGSLQPLFVKLRKENFKFIGDCFVEFSNAEEAERCVQVVQQLDGFSAMLMTEWMKQFKDSQITQVRKFTPGAEASSASTTSTSSHYSKDCSLAIPGLNQQCTLDLIKQAMIVPPAYVRYRDGEDKCLVRFSTTEERDLALENLAKASSGEPGSLLEMKPAYKLVGAEEEELTKRGPREPRENRGGGGSARGRGGGGRGGGFDRKRHGGGGGGDNKRFKN